MQEHARDLLDEAGEEVRKGWRFVKDKAGELDEMASGALNAAGAAIQVPVTLENFLKTRRPVVLKGDTHVEVRLVVNLAGARRLQSRPSHRS